MYAQSTYGQGYFAAWVMPVAILGNNPYYPSRITVSAPVRLAVSIAKKKGECNMVFEYEKSETSPIDFDFSGRFNAGDGIASVIVAFSPASGVSEIQGRRAVSGAIVQLRFDASGAASRRVYSVSVKATTVGGDTFTLNADLVIIPDSSPRHN